MSQRRTARDKCTEDKRRWGVRSNTERDMANIIVVSDGASCACLRNRQFVSVAYWNAKKKEMVFCKFASVRAKKKK